MGASYQAPVRRIGGRGRRSGEDVGGNFRELHLSSGAFTAFLVANSIPVVRRPMVSWSSLLKPEGHSRTLLTTYRRTAAPAASTQDFP